MQPLPHRYDVVARGGPTGNLLVESENLPTLEATAPAQFGGPGNVWSPEDLLVASVASCFILTFDTLAEFAHLPWIEIRCPTEAILEMADGKRRFTRFFMRPSGRRFTISGSGGMRFICWRMPPVPVAPSIIR